MANGLWKRDAITASLVNSSSAIPTTVAETIAESFNGLLSSAKFFLLMEVSGDADAKPPLMLLRVDGVRIFKERRSVI
jgi:hypothetical protein